MFESNRIPEQRQPVATVPSEYVVLDRSGQVVEHAATHTEALGVVDWMTRHDHAAGPFRCVPVA